METTTAPADSTSTPEMPSRRRLVRRKDHHAALLARILNEDKVVRVRGEVRHARIGDIAVTESDGMLVDVLPPETFALLYEDVVDGEITLSPAQVTRIARVIKFGGTKDAEALTKSVESVAKMKIGGINVDWNPAQRAELQHRAAKRGWTEEKYVQYLLDRFLQDIWSL